MKISTNLGSIILPNDCIASICGYAASRCFGVKGIVSRNVSDGLMQLLGVKNMSRGVKITHNEDGSVSIELHIIVDNGVNLMAVSRSIQSEVKYHVNRLTNVEVRSVDVCVDSMVIG